MPDSVRKHTAFDAIPPHIDGFETHPLRQPVEYVGDPSSSPTPLDPYVVYVGARHDMLSYIHWSHQAIADTVAQAAKMIELPACHIDHALAELNTALEMRVERNKMSYDRLLSSFGEAGPDPMLIDSVHRARCGAASASDLLQLVKRYPEMISVEFFKHQPMFDAGSYQASLATLNAAVRNLREVFHDAEITLLDRPEVTTPPFITGHQAIVWKEKIADCRSSDSHTEVIVKHTLLALPVAVQVRGVKHNHVRVGGTVYNLLPLSLSAYFRAADYKQRQGYVSPENEVRLPVGDDTLRQLGQLTGVYDAILQAIPPDHRKAYLASLSRQHASQPGGPDDNGHE